MFGIFKSQKSDFFRKYNILKQSDDPGKMLALSEELLKHSETLTHWDDSIPAKNTVLSTIHYERGRAYSMMLPNENLDTYEEAIECYQRSLTLLEPENRREKARVLYFLGISYADRNKGDTGENSNIAIAYLRKSVDELDEKEDAALLATSLITLGTLVSDLPSNSIRNNIEESLQLLKQAEDLLSNDKSQPAWLALQIRIANTIAKREVGTKRENVTCALALLNDIRTALDSSTHQRLKVDFLEAEFHCHLDQVSGDPKLNFEKAISVSEELITLATKLGLDEKKASMLVAIGMAWHDAAHVPLNERLEEAKQCFLSALEFFDIVRFPEMNSRVMGLLKSMEVNNGTGSTEDPQSAIDRKLKQLASINVQANFITWVDWMLDLGHLYVQVNGATRQTSILKAINVYQDLLKRLGPDDHVEQWTRCMRGLLRALKLRTDFPTPVAQLEIRLQLQTLLDGVKLDDNPAAWIESTIELAEFIRRDINGSRADNVEKSIALLESGLVAAISTGNSRLKAAVAHQLGSSFKERSRGSGRDNAMEAAKYFLLAKSLVYDFADQYILQKLDQDIQEMASRIQAAEQTPSVGTANASKSQSDHDDSDMEFRNRRGFQIVGDLLQEASRIDCSTDFDRWFDVMVRAAETRMHVWQEKGTEHGVNRMTDALAESGKNAIEILEKVLAATDRRERPAQWADVQWKIAGVGSMARLWADFRSTAGRSQIQNPDEVASSRDLSVWFTARSIEALAEYLQVYPKEYSPWAFLTASVRMGRMCMEIEDYSRAWVFFKEALKAFEVVSNSEDIQDDFRIPYVEALSDITTLGPQAGLSIGKTLESLILADASRFRAVSTKILEVTAKIEPECREEIQDLRTGIEKAEAQLANPWLFDRARFIDRIISNKQRIRKLLHEGQQLKIGAMDNVKNTITARPDAIFVCTHFSEFGGFVTISYKGLFGPKYDFCRVEPHNALSQIFGEGMPGEVWQWQSEYLEGQANQNNIDEHEWERILDQASTALYEAIGRPLHDLLRKHGLYRRKQLRLFIVPNGAIGNFPLGLMSLGSEEDQCLVEMATVSVAPNLSFLQHHRKRKTKHHISSQLGIIFARERQGELPPLPFAELEAHSVSRSWTGASETRIDTDTLPLSAALDALRSSDLWHFVCHARYDPDNALNASLLLGQDQSVSVKETIDLSSDARPRLVTLSACSSGLYSYEKRPDEQVGLPSAFLAAGAEAVVASLWAIDDVPASLLFTKFYEELGRSCDHPAHALRAAQLWLQKLPMRDVIAELEAWQRFERTSESAQLELASILEGVNQTDIDLDDCPFQDRRYWGGYIHIGR